MIDHEKYAADYDKNRQLFINTKNFDIFRRHVLSGAPVINHDLALYATQLISSQQCPKKFNSPQFFNDRVIPELLMRLATSGIANEQQQQSLTLLMPRLSSEHLKYIAIYYLRQRNTAMALFVDAFLSKEDQSYKNQFVATYCRYDASASLSLLPPEFKNADELLYNALCSSYRNTLNKNLISEVMALTNVQNAQSQLFNYVKGKPFIAIDELRYLKELACGYNIHFDAMQLVACTNVLVLYESPNKFPAPEQKLELKNMVLQHVEFLCECKVKIQQEYFDTLKMMFDNPARIENIIHEMKSVIHYYTLHDDLSLPQSVVKRRKI